MIKRFDKYFPPLFILGELIVLLTVILFSLYIAEGNVVLNNKNGYELFLLFITWPVLTLAKKDYKVGRAVSYYQTFKKAVTTTFLYVSFVSIAWILLDFSSISRSILVSLYLFLFLWMTIYRVSVHLALDRYRAFGGNIKKAVVLGYDSLGFKLFDVLKKKAHYGIRCKGFYADEIGDKKFEYPFLGSTDRFFKEDLEGFDIVYVSEKIDKRLYKRIIDKADAQLLKVKLLPEFNSEIVKSFSLRRFDDVSIVDLNELPLDTFFNRVTKRTFDILFSSIVILFVMSWLYPVLAIIIKASSRGPVLFKQRRHGVRNNEFVCFKFRTMELNDMADVKWATVDDPRVTSIGRFLRRTSLDEFPQFFNVLLGNMSIVGPRPHPISLNDSYRNRVEKFSKRHASKPGVTGLAQAMGYRGEIKEYHQMSSRVRLDRFYLQNWTFWLDLKIIFLTIFSIIRGQEKAY